jgi:serine/threonine protein kinase
MGAASETRLGRYEILGQLARGGMAEVWLAVSRGVGGFAKRCVLKTIIPELVENPDFVQMFINEALLAARLNHPNIVQIFDLGQIEDRYFIAMEYVPGRTLRQISRECRRRGRLTPPWFLLRTLAAVADGLHYAHGQRDDEGRPLSLVHRDITPENVMVTFTGSVKILDFGVAKASAAASTTRAGMLKGKYAYISPEQVQGYPADRRSDVYAMGVMLYELTTGVRPFRADNDLDLLRQVVEGEPRSPRELARWIPSTLDRLILDCLARDPEQRPQSAAELGASIEQLLQQAADHHTQRDLGLFISAFYPNDPDIPSDILASVVGRENEEQASKKKHSAKDGDVALSTAFEIGAPIPPPSPDPDADQISYDDIEIVSPEPDPAATWDRLSPIDDTVAESISLDSEDLSFDDWLIERDGGVPRLVQRSSEHTQPMTEAPTREVELKKAAPPKPAPGNAVLKPAASRSGPKPAASQSGPKPAASRSGPKPAASQSGPKPAASKSGSKPAASKSGPKPAASTSGPKPAASTSGPKPAASTSGPKPAASTSGPKPAASTSGPKPAASTSGPKPAASKSGPKPAASKSGPKPAASKSGPKPAASKSGPKPSASKSGPKPASSTTEKPNPERVEGPSTSDGLPPDAPPPGVSAPATTAAKPAGDGLASIWGSRQSPPPASAASDPFERSSSDARAKVDDEQDLFTSHRPLTARSFDDVFARHRQGPVPAGDDDDIFTSFSRARRSARTAEDGGVFALPTLGYGERREPGFSGDPRPRPSQGRNPFDAGSPDRSAVEATYELWPAVFRQPKVTERGPGPTQVEPTSDDRERAERAEHSFESGLLDLRDGRLEQALSAFVVAHELEPDNPIYRENLEALRRRLGMER